MPAADRRHALFEVALLLALTGLALWLRWPALWTEGFHNEDAAGIAYNADLLRAGGLPMVDNLELKAPGSFYLSWLAWALGGRSIATLQQAACIWAMIGAVGVYFGGRWLFDRRAGAIAALMYAVFAPVTDSIDINYGAWMAAPYIWAAAFFIRGLKTGRGRWWLFCGATLAIAGLMKRQAAFATPVFVALLVVGGRLRRPDDWAPAPPVVPALAYFFGGLALGFAPLMVFYLAQGELGAFISNYFFSEGGWKYAASQGDTADKLPRLVDGFEGFFQYMGTATLAAMFTVVMVLRDPTRRWGLVALFLGGHFALSFVGASIGLRFFKGYYLQVLPAAVWIAAHPSGALRRWFDGDAWRGDRRAKLRAAGLMALVALMLTPTMAHDLRELDTIRKRRQTARDGLAAKVGQFVNANTEATDRVWVWGRWGWPIYFHAERLAATRFPKTLAVFTTNLTNTWRRATKPTKFDPNSDWKSLMADLERDRPAFVVLSRNESYSAFTALKRFLRAEYRSVNRVGGKNFSVYRRKDLKLKAPPPKARKVKRRPKTGRKSPPPRPAKPGAKTARPRPTTPKGPPVGPVRVKPPGAPAASPVPPKPKTDPALKAQPDPTTKPPAKPATVP